MQGEDLLGLSAGQDVFILTGMPAKLDAQIRGLGAGFLPTCLAQSYLDTGRLVVKRVERPEQHVQVGYAWRKSGRPDKGRARQWWLARLHRRRSRAWRSWGARCIYPRPTRHVIADLESAGSRNTGRALVQLETAINLRRP